jgi:hypothetical protein
LCLIFRKKGVYFFSMNRNKLIIIIALALLVSFLLCFGGGTIRTILSGSEENENELGVYKEVSKPESPNRLEAQELACSFDSMIGYNDNRCFLLVLPDNDERGCLPVLGALFNHSPPVSS